MGIGRSKPPPASSTDPAIPPPPPPAIHLATYPDQSTGQSTAPHTDTRTGGKRRKSKKRKAKRRKSKRIR